MLVVAGRTITGHITDVYLISLDPIRHPVPDCLRRRRPYPVAMRAAVGASIYGAWRDPVVCGGYVPDEFGTAQCYVYSSKMDAWSQSSSLNTGRAWHAGSLHPTEGIIVSGGHQSGYVGLSPHL